MPKWLPRIVVVFLCFLLIACNKSESILLGTTTTLQDSGLLGVLVEKFNQQHAVQIKPIVAGSGHIFTLIERGDVDIAITHEPIGEQLLIERGVVMARIPLMYNYFLIVGPTNDPANIRLATSADDAFKRIYNSNSTFVSRNDNSGTHRIESKRWKAIKQRPAEDFYLRTGVGMGATLTITAEKNAYTLVDLGTWLNFQNKQSLAVLFHEKQTNSSNQAKQAALLNQYSLLTIQSNSLNQKYQKQAAVFAQWIQQDYAQQIISNYRIQQQAVFATNK